MALSWRRGVNQSGDACAIVGEDKLASGEALNRTAQRGIGRELQLVEVVDVVMIRLDVDAVKFGQPAERGVLLPSEWCRFIEKYLPFAIVLCC